MRKKMELIHDWHRRSQESSFAHYDAANILSKYHFYIGVPAVGFSAIIGTTIFANFQNTLNLYIQIAAGFFSIITCLLIALQTFMKFDERANMHRSAGAAYGSIRRELQQIIYSADESLLSNEYLSIIREKFDRLSKESPHISENIWNRTELKLSKYNTEA